MLPAPSLQLHATGMTHLTAGCSNRVPLGLEPPVWKTKPYTTYASQLGKLSLFLLFLLFDVPPFSLLFRNFITLAFVFSIASPSLILFSPFFSLEAMSRPAAGTPLSPTGQTAAL